MIDGGLTLLSLPGVPVVQPGHDLVAVIRAAADRADFEIRADDVVVVASKLVSRAEDCFVDLDGVVPSDEAKTMAARTGHDPRLVELVLRESSEVSRVGPRILITRHRAGHVSANAGIDGSNARPPGRGPGTWVLTLPRDADAAARRLRAGLGVAGVVITDSVGRPFRLGTVGIALGVAGLPALVDHRGQTDLFGYTLQHTWTGLADQLATAADLVAGQAAEGRGVTVVRGLRFAPSDESRAADLHRPLDKDLYR